MAYSSQNAERRPSRDPTYWRPSAHHPHEKGSPLDRFFDRNDLPMYKDKPHSYVRSSRTRPFWRRRTVQVLAAFVILLLYFLYRRRSGAPMIPKPGKAKVAAPKTAEDANGLRQLLREAEKSTDWELRQECVRKAFMVSWDAYETHAWGKDTYQPVTRTGQQTTPNGLGYIIVDALDTLILMNLTSRLAHAREWISTSLNFTQDVEVNAFDASTRLLGGLLGAHHLSTSYTTLAPQEDGDEDLYIEKATDLADRLITAFDSKSGVPFAKVNMQTRRSTSSSDDGGATTTAEAGGAALEWKYLALLLGEHLFWDAAEKANKVIDSHMRDDGLVPSTIQPQDGAFQGESIQLGARGGAYYEVLLKQYLLTAKEEPIYQEMWTQALAGVRKHLITYTSHARLTVLAERHDGIRAALSPRMEERACFVPGTIALSATGGQTVSAARRDNKWGPKQEGELHLARELTKTCWSMAQAMVTRLAPEAAEFAVDTPPLMERDGPLTSKPIDWKATDTMHGAAGGKAVVEQTGWRSDVRVPVDDSMHRQRPDTAAALFYMFRTTGDVLYRDWGWELFVAWTKHSLLDQGGFAGLKRADQLPAEHSNAMDSWWMSGTLKYLYLLFGKDDVLPLDKVVFSTAGHPLPVFKLKRGLKTGWTRTVKERAKGDAVKGEAKDEVKGEGPKEKKNDG